MRPITQGGVLSEDAAQSRRPPDLSTTPIQITAGPMLCRLRVWTDAEWDALADSERPIEYVYAPGLGWVGASPLECMN